MVREVNVRSYLRRVEEDGVVKYRQVRSHKKRIRLRKGVAQLFNPCTKRWVLVDTVRGGIISHKKSKGRYKNVSQLRERVFWGGL